MTYVPKWLRLWRESERFVNAGLRAAQRWQAWCPFCQQDTEHAHATTSTEEVKCGRCYRLHSSRATRPN